MYDEGQRRYDYPEGGEIEFEEENPFTRARDAAGGITERAAPLIKKYWWIAALAAVLLIAGLLLADFLFLSVRTVEVRIEDTEGSLIANAGIKIMETDGRTTKESFTGSKTIQIRNGSYPVKVSAPGYKQSSVSSITVSGSGSLRVVLEKDLDMELELDGEFPQQLFTGEERPLILRITNKKGGEAGIELVFEGGLDSKYVEAKYTKPLKVPAGTTKTEIKLKVKEDAAKEGLKGSIRIKYLKQKIEWSFGIVEFKEKNVRTSPASIELGRIKPGDVASKQVEIKNNNKFDMKDLKIEVQIDSTQYTDKNVVESWFHFSPGATTDVPAEEERNITIEVKPLITDMGNIPAGEEESIGGNLMLKTTYWSRNIRVSFRVKPVLVRLAVEGLKPSYTIKYNETLQNYGKETVQLTLKNKGEVPIEGIDIIPLPSKGNFCGTTTEWLQFNKTSFTKVGNTAADSEENIIIIIAIPKLQPRNETKICEFKVRYNNPLLVGEREVMPDCCQFILETQ